MEGAGNESASGSRPAVNRAGRVRLALRVGALVVLLGGCAFGIGLRHAGDIVYELPMPLPSTTTIPFGVTPGPTPPRQIVQETYHGTSWSYIAIPGSLIVAAGMVLMSMAYAEPESETEPEPESACPDS